MADKNITALIEKSIPRFVRIDYPKFTEFITTYYSQQETKGQGYEFLANLLDYSNVDVTDLEFLEQFVVQYLSGIPKNILPQINKRTLIKHIKEFYQSAGTENSIKFLFRLLFNEPIEIYYPTVDMLRVSDGKWQNDTVIKVSNSNLNDLIKDLEGAEILGEFSRARALVEKVTTYIASNGFYVAEIALTEIDTLHPISSFIANEFITGTGLSGTVFRERLYYILNSTSVSASGLFNAAGDLIEVKSNIGVDAFVIVEQVESGSIDGLEIIDGGSNYALNEIITFTSGTGAHARAKISAVNAGVITAVKMINNGYGYKECPLIEVESVAGDGAVFFPITSSIGKIKKLRIINFGVNYDNNLSANFPFLFPIHFYSVLAETNAYKILYYYGNDNPFILSETITGDDSGAIGTIRRLSGSNIIAIYQTNGVAFQEGENFTGSTSSENATIYDIESSIVVINTGAVGNYNGYFSNSDSFISSDKYIQDSYYYQDFSYVINTLRPKDEWINQLKQSVHPAGSIVFGFGEGETIVAEHVEGGFISPLWDTVELQKFDYCHPHIDVGGNLVYSAYSNTQIQIFYDVPMYYLAQLDPNLYVEDEDDLPLNTPRKTNFCPDACIQYTYSNNSLINIDTVNNLHIDSLHNLLLI